MTPDLEVMLLLAVLGLLFVGLALAIWLDAWLAGGLSRWWCGKVGHVQTEETPEAVVVFDTCSRCGQFKRAILAESMRRASP